MSPVRLGITTALALASLAASPAQAAERLFTYVYDVTTQPVGTREFEQYVTWKTDKDTDPGYDEFEFKTELEFGITDNLELGIYLAEWSYKDGGSVSDDGFEFETVAVRAIYNLSNPTTDTIGSGLYGELIYGGEKIAIEGGILLQKNVDRWVFAYNAIMEAEWEHAHYDEDKGVFEQSAGVSYQFSPSFSAGAEIVHEVEFDDWETTGHNAVYLGPNAAYRSDKWWATVTPLFQITDVADEVNFQLRLIFGFDF